MLTYHTLFVGIEYNFNENVSTSAFVFIIYWKYIFRLNLSVNMTLGKNVEMISNTFVWNFEVTCPWSVDCVITSYQYELLHGKFEKIDDLG